MKIHYETIDAFYQGIYILATKGLKFEADAYNLVIELTGGF